MHAIREDATACICKIRGRREAPAARPIESGPSRLVVTTREVLSGPRRLSPGAPEEPATRRSSWTISRTEWSAAGPPSPVQPCLVAQLFLLHSPCRSTLVLVRTTGGGNNRPRRCEPWEISACPGLGKTSTWWSTALQTLQINSRANSTRRRATRRIGSIEGGPILPVTGRFEDLGRGAGGRRRGGV